MRMPMSMRMPRRDAVGIDADVDDAADVGD